MRTMNCTLAAGLSSVLFLLVAGVAYAQEAPLAPSVEVRFPGLFQNPFAQELERENAGKDGEASFFSTASSNGGGAPAASPDLNTQPSGPLRINLSDAEGKAAAASKAKELASLNRTAAKYHRQAVQADYFPKINSSYFNLHFNKFLGKEIEFKMFNQTATLPLLSQDQSIFDVTVTQPVTPLLQVHEAVKIARADERIAQAKMNAVMTQISADVEHTYFSLLIAQRQQTMAEIRVKTLQPSIQLASLTEPPAGRAMPKQADLVEALKSLETTKTQVMELTRSLDTLIGLPADTMLELDTPPPMIETVSSGPASAQAIDKNPEVVEAQQTLEKARAAERLAKLAYVPEVAGLWGYMNQTAIPALPHDFSFVGFMASWNVFDFGKRERTISERSTQVKMAEANLALVRSKVAGAIQKTSLDVERTRRILQLTRQVALLYQSRAPLYQAANLEEKAAQAQAELEMFQAELDFRLAYGEMKRALGID